MKTTLAIATEILHAEGLDTALEVDLWHAIAAALDEERAASADRERAAFLRGAEAMRSACRPFGGNGVDDIDTLTLAGLPPGKEPPC